MRRAKSVRLSADAQNDDGWNLRTTTNVAAGAWLRGAVAATVASVVVGCSAAPTAAQHESSPARPLPHDPHTAAALLKIATIFNNDYDSGVYGPVYDRWDTRGKALISRADYIRRHTECPTSPTSARVESARLGPDGAWVVNYVANGARLTDYWFYVDGHWVFDLPLSNPSSVSLYKMSAAQYLAQLGCSH